MRILLLLILLVCTTSVQAQGFLRSIRERVESTVNNAVEEVESITNQEINDVNQDVYQSTDGIVDNVIPQVSTNGVSTTSSNSTVGLNANQSTGAPQGNVTNLRFWGTPSGNDLRAIDQEIQGLRLGMPVMYVDQILQERGYQRQLNGAYSKQQLADDGRIARTQRIVIGAVEPSQDFIDELAGGALKDRVLEAQQLINENQQAAQNSARQARTRESRRSASATNSVPRNLELVFLILYEQLYDQNVTQFDLDTVMDQVRSNFGPSTLPDDIRRSGLAFNSTPDSALIYHDAALLSDDYKNSLIDEVPEVRIGHKEAVYYALGAPCGGQENIGGPPGGGGCPPGWSDAFPDFEKQMELNRAVLSPFMRIKGARSGAGIETRLEWSYLQSERGIRERNAEEVARQNAPAAELDF